MGAPLGSAPWTAPSYFMTNLTGTANGLHGNFGGHMTPWDPVRRRSLYCTSTMKALQKKQLY